MNLLLLTFAGASVTGVWALAQRLLVAPVVLFQTVGRVGFVAFAKVATRDEDERQAQQVLGITALAAAALLAAIVGSVPALVGGVLGSEWEGVILPVTLAAAGWMVLGPLWVALRGLVQALRRPARAAAGRRGPGRRAVVGRDRARAALRRDGDRRGVPRRAATDGRAALRLLAQVRPAAAHDARAGCGHAAAAGAVSRAVADEMPTLAGLPLAVAAALTVRALLAVALMPRDLQRLAREAGFARILRRRDPHDDDADSSLAG